MDKRIRELKILGKSKESGHPNIKERLENNLILVILGTAFAAFVSGFGGIVAVIDLFELGIYQKSYISKLKRNERLWLRVNGISSIDGREIRILINANGVRYSYPSDEVWTTAEPNSVSEQFPVIGDADALFVEFSAIEKISTGAENRFQAPQVFQVPTIPFKGQFELIDNSGKYARVNYEVFRSSK
ncbi:MAG: hypothetical protein MRY77_02275 [Rhodobacteraceae bacterium]|nr:hypothetical protein [Paracoccaceae bacterium]